VDLFLAPDGYENFITSLFSLLGQKVPLKADSFESWPRLTSTPFFRAYLKIAEGCDHFCAYCIIPILRGPLRSRSKKEIIQEAKVLVENGVLELTLVAQDLTAWSSDGEDLLDLVRALDKISGLRWLRLMYAYPERLTEKLVKGLAQVEVLVPYLDVPFQHVSPSILKRMGRGAINPLQLVERLRAYWPELALRTTLMVGFPGETEADFDLLVNFVEEAKFEHLGVFKFSPEEGSRAASFPDQIKKKIKEKRRRIILAKQRKISLALNKKRIGCDVEILVEGPSDDSSFCFFGRANFQAPEVDGVVYFDGHQPSQGQLVRARFFKAGPYDLLAKLV
jgi:ribosomal protein S12 methylthiotransferase